MKNLISRDEYYSSMNEGFIGDKIKAFGNKVRGALSLGFIKLGKMIGLASSDGKVLPVISQQASVDYIASGNVKGVSVIASDGVKKDIETVDKTPKKYEVKIAGSNHTKSEIPTGKEYAEYISSGKYKEDRAYKNLLAIPSIIDELSAQYEGKQMPERLKNFKMLLESENRQRVSYTGGINGTRNVTADEFSEIVKNAINVKHGYNESNKDEGAILFFGAPGIGKSTIPNAIISDFNAQYNEPMFKMALINVNCADLAAGDMFMPGMGKMKDFRSLVNDNPDMFTAVNVAGMDDEKKEKFIKSLERTNQEFTQQLPQTWLPVYTPTGDRVIDDCLNDAANGNKVEIKVQEDTKIPIGKDKDGNIITKPGSRTVTRYEKTYNGGILLLDELLRADPQIFKQLMQVLLTGSFGQWRLGDKWTIMACSNRPCDDGQISEIYKTMGSAERNRFMGVYTLIPNKDNWIKWAKNHEFETIMLEFIFDEKATSGGEYIRWHNIGGTEDQGNDDKNFVEVTPRGWEIANNKIINAKAKYHVEHLTELSRDVLEKCLDPVGEDLASEFADYVDKNKFVTASYSDILKNPNIVAPDGDKAEGSTVVDNIWTSLEKDLEKGVKVNQEDVCTLIKWIGKYYKDASIGYEYFVQKYNDWILEKYVEKGLDDDERMDKVSEVLRKHRDVELYSLAAWPDKEDFETMPELLGMTADELENEVSDIANLNFPWNYDGGIKYLNEE